MQRLSEKLAKMLILCYLWWSWRQCMCWLFER